MLRHSTDDESARLDTRKKFTPLDTRHRGNLASAPWVEMRLCPSFSTLWSMSNLSEYKTFRSLKVPNVMTETVRRYDSIYGMFTLVTALPASLI